MMGVVTKEDLISTVSGGPVYKKEQLQVPLPIILFLNISPQKGKERPIHLFNKLIPHRGVRCCVTLLHPKSHGQISQYSVL